MAKQIRYLSPLENLLKPVKPLLDRQSSIELVCNTQGLVYAESQMGKMEPHSIPEATKEYWLKIANALAISSGQVFSTSKPILRGASHYPYYRP